MNEARDAHKRTWSECWRLLNSTPWQDAIRGRLTGTLLNKPTPVVTSNAALLLPTSGTLDDERAFPAHALPKPISQLIDDVVRRTWLWRRERRDVARELIAHFEDGLVAGQSESELVTNFGEPRSVARLIRRAKLRQRPWVWRASQRMLQAFGVFVAIVVVCWSWLLVRFLWAEPTIQHDFVGEWDQRTHAVAEDDRAWPMYRAALMRFHQQVYPDESSEDRTKRIESLMNGAQSKMWSFWLQHLENNREALSLTFSGAEKRQLGFVYRDETNREWLESRGPNGFDPQGFSRHQECARGLLVGVLLPHVEGLWDLHRLLTIDVEQARFERDRVRWLRAWSANLSLAEQLPPECAIIQLTAFQFASNSWSWLRGVLVNDPELLTDDDLRLVAHRIAAFQGGGRLRLKVDREFGDDLLQRFYTDDGHGDGRLTQDYFRMLGDVERRIFGKTTASRDPRRVDTILEWSALSGVIASRAELRQAQQQYFDLEESESAKPLWEQALDQPSPGQRLMHQWYHSRWQRLRLQPFLGIMQPLISMEETHNPYRPWQQAEFATQNRDATLVSIALTVYHRRQHQWPERLEQLCPDLLPEMPLDRFDGQPLRYRIVDDRPLLYSVGRNRIDEGGKLPTEKQDSPQARDGDWRLWPAPPIGESSTD